MCFKKIKFFIKSVHFIILEDTFDEDISNIESWNVKALNNFLAKNVQLDEDELGILMKEKIDGEDFFTLTREELKEIGIKGGPAGRIVALAERLSKLMFCCT